MNARCEMLKFYSDRGCKGSCTPPRVAKPRRRYYVTVFVSVAVVYVSAAGLGTRKKGYTEPY